jgi:hypothetical protein
MRLMLNPVDEVREIYGKLPPEFQEALVKYAQALLKNFNVREGRVSAKEDKSVGENVPL